MVGIERRETIKQQTGEAEKIISIQDVRRFLGWGINDASSKLILDLESLKREGHFSSEMGQKVIDIARRYNAVSAERLIENCSSLWRNPKFDFNEYGELVARAYQKFGARAGGYFSSSYAPIFNSGINPEEYFSWVKGAVESGGKIYAGWYVYGLPNVLKKRGNPLEFRSDACRVYRRGGLKVAVPFILNVPEALGEGKMGLPDFTQLSLEAIETLGKETAAWVVKNMADLANLGYAPERFLSHVQKLSEKKGEKGANWYASGFTDLLRYKKELAMAIKENRQRSFSEDREQQEWHDNHLKDLLRTDEKFNPLKFGMDYLELQELIGQNAATFYSLSTKKWDTWRDRLPEEIKDFELIPAKLMELHGKVSKKVFNSAMWYVLKMGHNPKSILRHLEDTITNFEKAGEQETLKALAYTAGIGRREGYPFGLEYPKEQVGVYADPSEPSTEKYWTSLLKHTDIDIAEEQELSVS